MMKFVLCLLAITGLVNAKFRISHLPESVWKNPAMRIPVDEKIVGGAEVNPNSIKFQLSFQTSYGFHFCGASVASNKTAITAAHCCLGQEGRDLVIKAGEHSLQNDDGTEQTVRVESFTIHPGYVTATQGNDVCVLELKEPLVMNKYVAAVNLPKQDEEFEGKAVVSGWGTLSSGGASPDRLHAVEVKIVSNAECDEAYSSASIDETMICAGEGGKDSCQGDSGGPLAADGVLYGIVSWGYGCAMEQYPGVYARASHYTNFIQSHMNK